MSNLRKPVAVFSVIAALTMSSCTSDETAKETVSPTTAGEVPPPDDSAAVDFKSMTVFFGFDDYTLNAEAQGTLNTLSEKLKAKAGLVVQIEGHCDERGSIEYNLALGDRRAQSVKNYLTQLGVDASRLTTISYGEERPAADGHSEDAWAKNRRAEFNVSGH